MPVPSRMPPFPKLSRGDKVAVLSPSFAAPGFAPAVHDQAMRRIRSELGLVPVEYPTTRTLGASAQARAADVNAAFADPAIRAIFATIGGDDQITVIPHLDEDVVVANPKPFFGYSDNTNLLNGRRDATAAWTWAGPSRTAEGRTWGGCFEVVDQIAVAGRMPSLDALHDTILMLESSEELPPATLIGRWLRALGERGVLGVVDGVVVARPPASSQESVPPPDVRDRLRAEQRDAVIDVMSRYNPAAVVCIGPPFGHTRPQWILPYGGTVRVDGRAKTVTASFHS